MGTQVQHSQSSADAAAEPQDDPFLGADEAADEEAIAAAEKRLEELGWLTRPPTRWEVFRWWLGAKRWEWFSIDGWRHRLEYRLGQVGRWLYERFVLVNDQRYQTNQYLEKHGGKWPARGILAGSVFDADDEEGVDEGADSRPWS